MNIKNILIFGGGNQASYTIEILRENKNYRLVGIIDSVLELGSIHYGIKVLGRVEHLSKILSDYRIDGGIVAIGDNYSRSLVVGAIQREIEDFEFISAIHSSAVISRTATIGRGVVIMAGCIVNPAAHVADFVFLATGSQVEHDVVLGPFSSLSAGVTTGGFVNVGRFSAVLLGATVLDRLKIGENVVIGASSLVVKDIDSNQVCYGHPAKFIRSRKLGDKYLK